MLENLNLYNHRTEGESFDAYKQRRKLNALKLKHHRKGKLIHNSSRDGTYRKRGN